MNAELKESVAQIQNDPNWSEKLSSNMESIVSILGGIENVVALCLSHPDSDEAYCKQVVSLIKNISEQEQNLGSWNEELKADESSSFCRSNKSFKLHRLSLALEYFKYTQCAKHLLSRLEQEETKQKQQDQEQKQEDTPTDQVLRYGYTIELYNFERHYKSMIKLSVKYINIGPDVLSPNIFMLSDNIKCIVATQKRVVKGQERNNNYNDNDKCKVIGFVVAHVQDSIWMISFMATNLKRISKHNINNDHVIADMLIHMYDLIHATSLKQKMNNEIKTNSKNDESPLPDNPASGLSCSSLFEVCMLLLLLFLLWILFPSFK